MSGQLYVASMMAMKIEGEKGKRTVTVAHVPALIQAGTEMDAELTGTMRMSHLYPPGDGWVDHGCNISEVADSEMDGYWWVRFPQVALDGSASLDD